MNRARLLSILFATLATSLPATAEPLPPTAAATQAEKKSPSTATIAAKWLRARTIVDREKTQEGSFIVIKIITPDSATVEASTVQDPLRIVLDFTGTRARKSESFVIPKNEMVSNVRFGAHSDKMRVVIDLTASVLPYFEWKPGSRQVILRIQESGNPAKKDLSPATIPTVTFTATSAFTATPISTAKPADGEIPVNSAPPVNTATIANTSIPAISTAPAVATEQSVTAIPIPTAMTVATVTPVETATPTTAAMPTDPSLPQSSPLESQPTPATTAAPTQPKLPLAGDEGEAPSSSETAPPVAAEGADGKTSEDTVSERHLEIPAIPSALATPEATAIPQPTATIAPTATVTATATAANPTKKPTKTPVAKATRTPVATRTPIATRTPVATRTARQTPTSSPTPSPSHTPTAAATSTPVPATPIPVTPTPATPTAVPTTEPTVTAQPTSTTPSPPVATLGLLGKSEPFPTATAAPQTPTNFQLTRYSFDFLEPGRIPVLKIVLNKVRPQAQISKIDSKTYMIDIADCSLSRPGLGLPQYPPAEFRGFLLVSSSSANSRLTITINVDAGTTLGTFVRNNEIWVKRL